MLSGEPFERTLSDGTLATTPGTSLFGGYLQASYLFGDHALFLMTEAYQRDKADLMLSNHTPYTNYLNVHWGHRYSVNQNVIIKTGHSYTWTDRLSRFDLQIAFRL